ncbi:hypothetical protein COCON_G00219570 [Conger conger]|uniref:Uncharacterized protein n=1 Tax=Conger conger TaxID=82655 RepID=A0A9Q1CZ20_CONCO|nr:hypothetical protein COCON_G00219570 [Conger conger]
MFERSVRCPRMPVVEGGRGATPLDPSVSPALSAQQTDGRLLASVTHLSTGGVTGSSSGHRPVREQEGGRRDGGMDGAEDRGRRMGELDYLDLTDFRRHQNDLAEGVALPGEVAEDPPAYTPSICRRTELDLRTRPVLEPRTQSPRPAVQTEPDEVLPFSLDAGFDYDHVALSRKHPVP